MHNHWLDGHHDWSWMERSVECADRFYQYDQHLSSMDRERLADFFQQRKSLAPVFGISAAIGLSFLPMMLRHRGGAVPRHAIGHFSHHRGFVLGRIFLAFIGYQIGRKAGDAALRSYQRDQLWGHDAAAGAYSVMGHYPPEIGWRYFRSTARNPDLRMKDPRRLAQFREPPFPMNLLPGWSTTAPPIDRFRGPTGFADCMPRNQENLRYPPQFRPVEFNNTPQSVPESPTDSQKPRSYGLWSTRGD